MFTALFLISEGTADIKIRGLPVGGIVAAKEEKPAETKPEVQAEPKKAPEKKKAPAKKNGVGKPWPEGNEL